MKSTGQAVRRQDGYRVRDQIEHTRKLESTKTDWIYYQFLMLLNLKIGLCLAGTPFLMELNTDAGEPDGKTQRGSRHR